MVRLNFIYLDHIWTAGLVGAKVRSSVRGVIDEIKRIANTATEFTSKMRSRTNHIGSSRGGEIISEGSRITRIMYHAIELSKKSEEAPLNKYEIEAFKMKRTLTRQLNRPLVLLGVQMRSLSRVENCGCCRKPHTYKPYAVEQIFFSVFESLT